MGDDPYCTHRKRAWDDGPSPSGQKRDGSAGNGGKQMKVNS